MPFEVTILSVTANTPVDIYCCNLTGGSCTYISTVSTFPYVFNAPDSASTSDFTVKIVDTQGCEVTRVEEVTPTPTPNVTPTCTITPTQTPSQTISSTPTNTPSPTTTLTSTPTPTFTPSPSSTPIWVAHSFGNAWHPTSALALTDYLNIGSYWYTYISAAYLTPVIGATVYTLSVGDNLYNPINGGSRWRLMTFGVSNYAVQIDSAGQIIDFTL